MTKGLRVVKRGSNIKTTKADDVLFSSEYKSPKVYDEGTQTIKVDSSGNYHVEIPHGLGYPPVCFIYLNPINSIVNSDRFGGTYYPIPNSWGFADNFFDFVISESDKIILEGRSRVSNSSLTYHYYIFVEPATDE